MGMSQYYRDLHDRELLSLAEAVLQEVQARSLLDVFLPAGEDQSATAVFPRRLSAISNANGRLSLRVERNFFEASGSASA